jgi:hypothetical protein
MTSGASQTGTMRSDNVDGLVCADPTDRGKRQARLDWCSARYDDDDAGTEHSAVQLRENRVDDNGSTAHGAARRPTWLVGFTLAPSSMSRSTVSSCPLLAAQWSAVACSISGS